MNPTYLSPRWNSTAVVIPSAFSAPKPSGAFFETMKIAFGFVIFAMFVSVCYFGYKRALIAHYKRVNRVFDKDKGGDMGVEKPEGINQKEKRNASGMSNNPVHLMKPLFICGPDKHVMYSVGTALAGNGTRGQSVCVWGLSTSCQRVGGDVRGGDIASSVPTDAGPRLYSPHSSNKKSNGWSNYLMRHFGRTGMGK